MEYYRTFDGPTIESHEEDINNCTDCGSDRTTYLNYINGEGELRRCHDCDNEFIIEEE